MHQAIHIKTPCEFRIILARSGQHRSEMIYLINGVLSNEVAQLLLVHHVEQFEVAARKDTTGVFDIRSNNILFSEAAPEFQCEFGSKLSACTYNQDFYVFQSVSVTGLLPANKNLYL